MLSRSLPTNPFGSLAARHLPGAARLVSLLGCAALLTLAGCSASSPPSAPGTSAPSAVQTSDTVPSTPADAGAASALDAYRGMWRAYVEAIRIPDPSYPDLARYTQGDALQVLVTGLTSVRDDGLVGVGDVTINPRVVAERPGTPTTVDIEDCVDTSQSHLVKRDGSPYQDNPGGRQSARATTTEVSPGRWMVTSFALFGVGTC
jgi:hypothetical protein